MQQFNFTIVQAVNDLFIFPHIQISLVCFYCWNSAKEAENPEFNLRNHLHLVFFPFVKTSAAHHFLCQALLQSRCPGDFYRLERPNIRLTHVQQVFVWRHAPLEGGLLVPGRPTYGQHLISTKHSIGGHLHKTDIVHPCVSGRGHE